MENVVPMRAIIHSTRMVEEEALTIRLLPVAPPPPTPPPFAAVNF